MVQCLTAHLAQAHGKVGTRSGSFKAINYQEESFFILGPICGNKYVAF